jgi:proteasome lid subunit RPN8/RPN11
MIRIENEAWRDMVAHAQAAYPNECCGAMLGLAENGTKVVRAAVALDNAFEGEQRERYLLRPEDLLAADREAHARSMDLVGIYHSHPDCGAYFSKTDLENSCPWYSFVVLSVKEGRFDHAASFLPNLERTAAPE